MILITLITLLNLMVIRNNLDLNKMNFYEFDKSDIAFLKSEADKMLDAKPNFYVYKKHVDKLDKLQSRLENSKLDSKTLLISTW